VSVVLPVISAVPCTKLTWVDPSTVPLTAIAIAAPTHPVSVTEYVNMY
jgi:hypothetical protein